MRETPAVAESRSVVPDAAPPAAPELRFRDIFEAELAFVWNSLRRFGIQERDLEDVAHEVFVVLHAKMGEYDRAKPLRPWLFGISFRCASNHRGRTSQRRELLVEAEEPVDPAPAADEALAHKDRQRVVREALQSLPLDRRAVVILYDLEGTAMQDVADALSIPLATAYSRLRVGRQELSAALRRTLGKGAQI